MSVDADGPTQNMAMMADQGMQPETVDCPFCAEPIKPQAIICKHCRRDVALPMPLLIAQRAQARQIEALRCEMVELRAELLAARSSPREPCVSPDLGQSNPISIQLSQPPSLWSWVVFAGWALCLAGLLLLHALLVFRLDASVGALRAACIGWPLLVGLLLPSFSHLAPRWLALLAASLGLAAVTAMSGMVARLDGTPVLPGTARDLFELLEFALSISLALAAGGLARRALRRGREREIHRKTLDRAREALTGKAELVNRITEACLPLLAVSGAVIAGFRAIFGGS